MFVFKFDRLLSIKSKLLEDKKMKIASITRKIESLRDERNLLERENKNRRDKIYSILTSDKPDRNMVLFLSELLEKTDFRIRELEKAIEDLNTKRDRLIEEAKELLKEKRKYEKLKEKQFEEYRLEERRSQVRLLDEITSTKVASRSAHSS